MGGLCEGAVDSVDSDRLASSKALGTELHILVHLLLMLPSDWKWVVMVGLLTVLLSELCGA